MTVPATQSENVVARPLHVLVPLIKKDLEQGKEAAEQAGMPYYRAAGEKMLEAKGQIAHGEFTAWVKRNFGISLDQAGRYMGYAKITFSTSDRENPRARDFSSLREVDRHTGRDRARS